jgi:hypothetical protein
LILEILNSQDNAYNIVKRSKKIEPYLTFLNVPQLERQGAGLQTKIEELQIINQSLIENDKVKEDALSHLSDQLLVLSERIQQIERKQII